VSVREREWQAVRVEYRTIVPVLPLQSGEIAINATHVVDISMVIL
jgi:hypothetical protein